MARNWIVVGDTTSSGGRVITGSPVADVDGMPVSRVSDSATCPRHKGVFPIVDGDITLIVDGQPVALHGSSLACGCKVLTAQQSHVYVDTDSGAGASAAAQAATNGAATIESNVQYDEAIRFVNAAGAALAGISYTLFLESRKAVTGHTDSDGKTVRVVTEVPEKIVKAELKPESAPCCPLHAEHMGSESKALEVEIDEVATNGTEIGASLQQVATPKDEARGLTPGEIEMARLVFGNSIKYEEVKVHNGEYLWLGMQPDDTAMTPNGEMYFNPKHFKEDFSSPADLSSQQWFMHEMAHVWQHQLGYPVKWRGAARIGLSYKYILSADKSLSDYNMEAQGNILADYFMVKHRNRQHEMYEGTYWYDPSALSLLEKVLADFLKDPGSKGNLP